MTKQRLLRLSLLLILAVAGLVAWNRFDHYKELRQYREQIAQLTICDVNLQDVPNGSYRGSLEVIWVGAEVAVTVQDHTITGIELISHKNGRGEPAEVIPDRVLQAQSLQVDLVTGCTASSKVILKAIEQALTSGLQAPP